MRRQLDPGEVIGGKFRIERPLGAGGMGAVVEATDVVLARKIALKIAHEELVADTASRHRFLREARAMAALEGAGFVRVFEVGSLPDETPFLAMELLQGEDLQKRLRNEGPLSLEELATFIGQACEALAEAHAMNLVHRDIKPSNLFVEKRKDGRETLRVLDFGISRPADAKADALTQSAGVLGSPRYMSPEQALDPSDVDVRSDVWSLGVTMYELWTGKIPFEGASPMRLYKAIIETDPIPPSVHRPDTPPGLEAAILRALEKNREDRGGVDDLATALATLVPSVGAAASSARALLAGRSVPVRAASGPVDPQADTITSAAGAGTETAPGMAGTSSPAERRPRRWIGVAVVAGGALVAGGAALFIAADTAPSSARTAASVAPSPPRPLTFGAATGRAPASVARPPIVRTPAASRPPDDDVLNSSH